jgi:ABC-2 type transport system permease protein
MHNLSTVIHFEVTRTLKKKSFWIMALGFPVLIMAIFVIIFLSNQSTSDAIGQLKTQSFSIEVTDESGLVNPALLSALGAETITSKAQGIADVTSGNIDGYIFYPSDISNGIIEIYGKNVDIFNNARYESFAKYLLTSSVQAEVSPQVKTVLSESFSTSLTVYRDGQVYEPVKEMILPGVFLILFYLLIAFFGNQMLTSTTEEKENRVIEMILTTIEARTLITGKIISLILLALLQACVIIVPAFIIYVVFHGQLQLPWIDLTTLPLNWPHIGVAFAIFFLSFILFTGLLVLIGSSVPTAKDAGGFIGLVMLLIFGPLYAVTLFVSSPSAPLVTVLSLFPFTAPIPLLLRNAAGNLQGWEIAVALPLLAITAVITITLAIRVFRYGALEYSRRVSLKDIFTRK